MKIALISFEGGGASTVSNGLAYSLSKRQIPTTIFTDTQGGHQTSKVMNNLTMTRLHRMNLPPRTFWFQIQNFNYLLESAKQFDLIHGVAPDSSTLLAFQKKNIGKPFLVSFHAAPLANVQDFIRTPPLSWTTQDFAHQILEFPLHYYNIKQWIAYADHIFVCSYSALSEFKAAYPELNLGKVSVIYNAMHLSDVKSIESKKREDDHLSIAFAGRLFWTKGPMLLLKAFKLIAEEFKNVRLDLFGVGPQAAKLKAYVANSNLGHQVCFHGRIPNTALISRIKSADLVVAPSMHEAQSMFILEAMACKKPTIAFNIPSMKEIITDGKNGFLVRSFVVKDLAEKMRLALSDEKLRTKIGENAYEYVRAKHNWDIQVEKYLAVYNKFL